MDLRFGGWLGGTERTKFAHLEARDVGNSDYGILDQIPWSIGPGEVLVDLGCGKGRVLNWWLANYPRNQIIGVELDPGVAERARVRLGGYRQVQVITGSAPEVLATLERADVIYMANPFGPSVMSKVADVAKAKRSRAFYYNFKHLECWADWNVREMLVKAPWGTAPVAVINRLE